MFAEELEKSIYSLMNETGFSETLPDLSLLSEFGVSSSPELMSEYSDISSPHLNQFKYEVDPMIELSCKQPIFHDNNYDQIRLRQLYNLAEQVNPVEKAPILSSQTPRVFACTQCPKSFNKLYYLQSHMKTHSNVREFSCSVCDLQFCRKYDLQRHEKRHFQTQKLQCNLCPKAYSRMDALKRHIRNH